LDHLRDSNDGIGGGEERDPIEQNDQDGGELDDDEDDRVLVEGERRRERKIRSPEEVALTKARARRTKSAEGFERSRRWRRTVEREEKETSRSAWKERTSRARED